MRHVGNMPHRVMALKVSDVEPSWSVVGHPLYNLFFHVNHPDVDVGGTPDDVRRYGMAMPSRATHFLTGLRPQ